MYFDRNLGVLFNSRGCTNERTYLFFIVLYMAFFLIHVPVHTDYDAIIVFIIYLCTYTIGNIR